MKNFNLNLKITLFKDDTGKFVNVSPKVIDGRIQKVVELVDTPEQATPFTDAEAQALPEELKELLSPFRSVGAVVKMSM